MPDGRTWSLLEDYLPGPTGPYDGPKGGGDKGRRTWERCLSHSTNEDGFVVARQVRSCVRLWRKRRGLGEGPRDIPDRGPGEFLGSLTVQTSSSVRDRKGWSDRRDGSKGQ